MVDERCYIIRRGGGSEYVSRASVPLSDFEAEGCAARGGQPVLSPLSHRSTSRSRLGGAARVAACATRPRPPFPHHQSGLRLNRVGGVKPNSSCRLRGYIPSTPALQAGADASPAQHCRSAATGGLVAAAAPQGWALPSALSPSTLCIHMLCARAWINTAIGKPLKGEINHHFS